MFKILFITIFLPFIIANPFVAIRPAIRPGYSIPKWGRIVGGEVIGIENAPHQISLQDGTFHICGGSVIAPGWVLTAAHCTDGNNANRLSIRAGSSRYSTGGTIVGVQQIFQHPKYNPYTIDFDYSLLKLSESLKFSEQTKSIALPAQDAKVENGTLCTVTGWGNTQNVQESREILRSANVPKVDQDECNEAYKTFGGVTDRMICAGFPNGGVDACQGDSGGPLVSIKDNLLIGGKS